MKKNVGIIGATGYAGEELVRLLLNHPNVNLAAISSVSFENKMISEIYPALKKVCDKVLVNDMKVIEECDVIFASLPHGLSEKYAKMIDKAGKLFIDLGADFRLDDVNDYKEWYKLDYNEEELHKKQVYGLPELNREKIKTATIIGNPGCYPTSVALGMYPLMKNNLVDVNTIIVDAKSGATGAGRGLSQNTHYTDLNEAFAPYKIAQHRHTPEIEQTLSNMSGEKVMITFVPHLLPINRGIVSTIYSTSKCNKTVGELITLYKEMYKDEPFIRIMDEGNVANLKNVKYSNFCDISIHDDPRTKRIIIVAAIDNMVKGAAGQAIQNLNIMMNWTETMGLDIVPPAF
ncbi:MAG: N-acetyl-gamma-glutamyl-phosphate reductase [Erysipelotrichaceae bacterium]